MSTGLASRRLFCFGLGFSALALARHLARQGYAIAGTCRSEEKAAKLRDEGIEAFVYSSDHALDPTALQGTTHLLVSIPPDENDDRVARTFGPLLQQQPLQWVGYLSTTGVYGDRGGDWVDEASPLTPGTARGQRRLEAEKQWAALDLLLHIFRLAGIYGPGRNQLAALRAGTARRIIKPGQIFSRIHVEDIANVLAASIAQPHPGAAYNVCDNEPAPPQDVIAYGAKLLGIDPPPEILFEDADLSPMAKSFYAESKRVSNQRLREELGVTLTYPTYREGLKALLEQSN